MWKNSFTTELVEIVARDGLVTKDSTVEGIDTSAWSCRITFYEPLETDVPKSSYPYCCYLNTVIFTSDSEHLAEIGRAESMWDLLGTRWTDDRQIGFSALEPFVWHDGRVWKLVSGQVVWANGQWYKAWGACLVRDDDKRLATSLMREQIEVFGRENMVQ